jgi:predicted PolB exonuclease-like 3'-5' exonuclease
MIVALDVETMSNPDMIGNLPEPEVALGNTKDPAKVAAKIAEAKAEQVEKMALDPMTARIICYAAVGGNVAQEPSEKVVVADAPTDEEETVVVESIFGFLGKKDIRLVSWNGIGFDLPMIYKRAMILGVDPGQFGAPPLSAWTKRYAADKHYDLMQIWGGWDSHKFAKLDTVARMVLADSKTDGIDVTTFPVLMQSDEGRTKIAEYCLQDTRLTWRLWNRFNGFLFA